MTLREIIKDLARLNNDLVIFATKNEKWQIDMAAALILESDMDALGIRAENLTYFLEVEVAKSVVDVWRKWHDGKEPDETQRLEALTYYADNDA